MEVMGGWLPIIAHVELVTPPVVTQIAVRGERAPQWQPRLTLPGTEEGLELQASQQCRQGISKTLSLAFVGNNHNAQHKETLIDLKPNTFSEYKLSPS